MHLLDTDSLPRFHIGHPRSVERVRARGEEHVATTVIREIEVRRSSPSSPRALRNTWWACRRVDSS